MDGGRLGEQAEDEQSLVFPQKNSAGINEDTQRRNRSIRHPRTGGAF